MMANTLVGKRFGKLVVIAEDEPYVKDNRVQRRWLCKCDCGRERVKWQSNLTTGQATSCGCTVQRGKERPVEQRYGTYRRDALKRGYAFELTLDEFDALTQEPCAYCGTTRGSHRGVDRKDNTRGYVEDNVVACCFACNRAKGFDLTPEEFREWAKQVYLHSIKETTDGSAQ